MTKKKQNKKSSWLRFSAPLLCIYRALYGILKIANTLLHPLHESERLKSRAMTDAGLFPTPAHQRCGEYPSSSEEEPLRIHPEAALHTFSNFYFISFFFKGKAAHQI